VQSPHANRKHASNQNAQRDVIEDMTENVNVHGIAPTMRKLAHYRHINVAKRRD
jgi:hypothetical protein